MNRLLKNLVILLLLSCFLVGCFGHGSNSTTNPKAKNIILFIGDGMGAEHRKAARWATVGKNGKLSMDDMPISGSLQTYSADNTITDSAAATTAIATGVKTNNRVIALDANLSHVSTILEKAKAVGKRVGLVTTTHITHATPAAFVSHIEDRRLMIEIAEQILLADVDVLLGGGENVFLPTSNNGCFPEPGKRRDGRNLINEFISIGYEYVCDPASFAFIEPISTYKLLGLFSDEGMTRPFSPSLADMTDKAIAILSNSPDGFFLMVEGGQIDWASHRNDAANMISDTVAFDDAVEIAHQFASMNSETLIIVTADHETGGMTVSSLATGLPGEDGPFTTPDGDYFYINWSTTRHTDASVPVTSQGPLSNRLNGINNNTIIHDVILSAL